MERDKESKVSANLLIAVAENAKAINNYASLSPASQQLLLARFIEKEDSDEQRKLTE